MLLSSIQKHPHRDALPTKVWHTACQLIVSSKLYIFVFFLVNLIGMHAGSCDSKALSWAIKNMLDLEKMMITFICFMGNIKFEFEFLFYIVCTFNAP